MARRKPRSDGKARKTGMVKQHQRERKRRWSSQGNTATWYRLPRLGGKARRLQLSGPPSLVGSVAQAAARLGACQSLKSGANDPLVRAVWKFRQTLLGCRRVLEVQQPQIHGITLTGGTCREPRGSDVVSSHPRRQPQTTRANILPCQAPTEDRILALHRERPGGSPEDSVAVNEVEMATPSGPRRRRRLSSL